MSQVENKIETFRKWAERFPFEVIQTGKKYLIFTIVELKIGRDTWTIYVDDEYQDLLKNKQLFSLYLVLRELQEYSDSDDYLDWCANCGLESNDDHLLAYFRDLGRISREIEAKIGTFELPITDFEYQMRISVVDQLLRKD